MHHVRDRLRIFVRDRVAQHKQVRRSERDGIKCILTKAADDLGSGLPQNLATRLQQSNVLTSQNYLRHTVHADNRQLRPSN